MTDQLSFDKNRTLVIVMATHAYNEGSKFINVPQAEKNIEGMIQALSDPEIIGINPDHIITIDNVDNQAAELELISIFTGKKLKPDGTKIRIGSMDSVFFYYVGHAEKVDEELCLSFINTNRSAISSTSLSISTISGIISKASNLIHRYYFLDCCNAEQAKYARNLGGYHDYTDLFNEPHLKIRGTFLAASSRKDEQSGMGDDKFTEFTGAILQLMTDGLDHKDFVQFIDSDIFKVVIENNPALTYRPVISNAIFDSDKKLALLNLFKNRCFSLNTVEEKLASGEEKDVSYGIQLYKKILAVKPTFPAARDKDAAKNIAIAQSIAKMMFEKEFGSEYDQTGLTFTE
jgi:hypothetical protein